MKVLLFTPTVRESAIAGVAELLTAELLAQGADVSVIAAEFSRPEPVSQRGFGAARVLHWLDETDIELQLAAADRVIHQVGDNWQFHAGNVRWLPRTHGVVILHDYFLGSLLAAYLNSMFHDDIVDGVEHYLRSWVGENLDWLRGLDFRNDLAAISARSMLNEWVALDADAVIVHSDFALDKLQPACGLPVRVLPLPRPKTQEISAGSRAEGRDGKLVLGMFGHVNPNRLVIETIETIGHHPDLKDRVELRLVGPIEPEVQAAVSRAASANQVSVRVLGRVSDRQFQTEAMACDAVIAFRQPPLESASASVLDLMSYAKPCVVLDHGFYHSIPSDCVFKLVPNSMNESLNPLLIELVQHPELLAQVGARAAEYIESHADIASYLEDIQSVFQKINNHRAQIEAGRDIGEVLSQWGGLNNGVVQETIVESVASMLAT